MIFTYNLLKKLLLKLEKIKIDFDYLVLFFDDVQIEEEKKNIKKAVNEISYSNNECKLSIFDNFLQQQEREKSQSSIQKDPIFSLVFQPQSNSYTFLLYLVPSKAKDFLTEAIRQIKGWFLKECGSEIDHYIYEEKPFSEGVSFRMLEQR